MAGRLRTFKPDEQIVSKTCENPDCEKQFFVTSRYAVSTRYCSNKCLQHAFYLNRKLRENEFANAENIENDVNNQNTYDMDAMEKILAMKDELNELKTKLLLQERDMQDLNRLKAELTSAKQENEDLESKLEAYKTELEEYKESNQEISGECIQLEKKCKTLLTDKETLILANIILQSRELPDFTGRKINFGIIQKYIPEFKYKENQSFTIQIWHWTLTHQAGDSFVLISNAKKA